MTGTSETQPLRIAILLQSERDQAHLEQVIRLAARTSGLDLQLTDSLRTADVVVLRRSEPGSARLLAANAPARPIPLLYTSNSRDTHPWRLRDPARTADLIPVFRFLLAELHGVPVATEPPPARRKQAVAGDVRLFR